MEAKFTSKNVFVIISKLLAMTRINSASSGNMVRFFAFTNHQLSHCKMNTSFDDVALQVEEKLKHVQSLLDKKAKGDSSASLNLQIMKGVNDCEKQVKQLEQVKQTHNQTQYSSIQTKVKKIKEDQRRILLGIAPTQSTEREKFDSIQEHVTKDKNYGDVIDINNQLDTFTQRKDAISRVTDVIHNQVNMFEDLASEISAQMGETRSRLGELNNEMENLDHIVKQKSNKLNK
jgi:archaellum component FlaC